VLNSSGEPYETSRLWTEADLKKAEYLSGGNLVGNRKLMLLTGVTTLILQCDNNKLFQY